MCVSADCCAVPGGKSGATVAPCAAPSLAPAQAHGAAEVQGNFASSVAQSCGANVLRRLVAQRRATAGTDALFGLLLLLELPLSFHRLALPVKATAASRFSSHLRGTTDEAAARKLPAAGRAVSTLSAAAAQSRAATRPPLVCCTKGRRQRCAYTVGRSVSPNLPIAHPPTPKRAGQRPAVAEPPGRAGSAGRSAATAVPQYANAQRLYCGGLGYRGRAASLRVFAARRAAATCPPQRTGCVHWTARHRAAGSAARPKQRPQPTAEPHLPREGGSWGCFRA